MVELVQQLLFAHNCVIIPDFGAFIGNYAPAELHLMDKKIVPPHKTIAFNRSLQKNDGLLINAAAQQFDLSYVEAEIKVAAFALECNTLLKHHNSLIFNNIGRLVVDTENNIRFQPYHHVNYQLQSYGLPTLDIEPVHRLKDDAKIIQESYQRILHPERLEVALAGNKSSRWKKWVYGLTAFIVIAVTSISLSWNVHNNVHRSESSIVSSFDTSTKPSVAATIRIIPTVASTPAASEVAPVNNTTVQDITAPVALNSTSSIIIGAFFDEARANKLKSEAESKGYSVSISEDTVNGLFRTAVMVEVTQTDSILQKIKAEINSRAWVYCVRYSPN